jgi:tRNA-binding EMAP/Myf-like protein
MKGACLVMVNLKPRSLAKFMSNGMVISVSTQDHDGFKLVRPIGANS